MLVDTVMDNILVAEYMVNNRTAAASANDVVTIDAVTIDAVANDEIKVVS